MFKRLKSRFKEEMSAVYVAVKATQELTIEQLSDKHAGVGQKDGL
jgi:hypothetical protein